MKYLLVTERLRVILPKIIKSQYKVTDVERTYLHDNMYIQSGRVILSNSKRPPLVMQGRSGSYVEYLSKVRDIPTVSTKQIVSADAIVYLYSVKDDYLAVVYCSKELAEKYYLIPIQASDYDIHMLIDEKGILETSNYLYRNCRERRHA